MKRQIIEIDEAKCTGCGLCIPGCPEGALQIIDGKARLISDLFCDGLGACLGDCPEGAITTIEREAEPYDEAKVMENIIKAGEGTIKAHLKHLKDHGETTYLNQAIEILKAQNIAVPSLEEPKICAGTCPGSNTQTIDRPLAPVIGMSGQTMQSELRSWPIQLHLLNPNAPFLENADLLIAADCTPFAYPNFHERFMKNKVVINFCPKLDHDIDKYVDKLAEIFANRNIKSLSIVRMEVPCCGGIERIVQMAMQKSISNGGVLIMPKVNIISIKGNII